MTKTRKIQVGLGVFIAALLAIGFASIYPFDKVQAPETPLSENTLPSFS